MSTSAVEAGKAYIRVFLKSDIDKSAAIISKEMKDVAKQLRTVGESVASIGKVITVAWGSALAALAAPITIAANIEDRVAEFKALTGSIKTATDVITELRQFAAKTPLQFEGLANETRLLLGYGVGVRDVVGDIKVLSEVAGGSQERLNRMALAFGQVRAIGRLMATELRQFTESGFNPLQEMAVQTHQDIGVLIDRMHDGLITFEDVRKALIGATSAGGRFFGLLEARSKTLRGLFTTLLDNIKIAIEPIGEAFVPTLKELIKAGIEFAKVIRNVAEASQPLIRFLGGISAAGFLSGGAIFSIGTALLVTSKIMSAFTDTVLGTVRAFYMLRNIGGLFDAIAKRIAASSQVTSVASARIAVGANNATAAVAGLKAETTTATRAVTAQFAKLSASLEVVLQAITRNISLVAVQVARGLSGIRAKVAAASTAIASALTAVGAQAIVEAKRIARLFRQIEASITSASANAAKSFSKLVSVVAGFGKSARTELGRVSSAMRTMNVEISKSRTTIATTLKAISAAYGRYAKAATAAMSTIDQRWVRSTSGVRSYASTVVKSFRAITKALTTAATAAKAYSKVVQASMAKAAKSIVSAAVISGLTKISAGFTKATKAVKDHAKAVSASMASVRKSLTATGTATAKYAKGVEASMGKVIKAYAAAAAAANASKAKITGAVPKPPRAPRAKAPPKPKVPKVPSATKVVNKATQQVQQAATQVGNELESGINKINELGYNAAIVSAITLPPWIREMFDYPQDVDVAYRQIADSQQKGSAELERSRRELFKALPIPVIQEYPVSPTAREKQLADMKRFRSEVQAELKKIHELGGMQNYRTVTATTLPVWLRQLFDYPEDVDKAYRHIVNAEAQGSEALEKARRELFKATPLPVIQPFASVDQNAVSRVMNDAHRDMLKAARSRSAGANPIVTIPIELTPDQKMLASLGQANFAAATSTALNPWIRDLFNYPEELDVAWRAINDAAAAGPEQLEQNLEAQAARSVPSPTATLTQEQKNEKRKQAIRKRLYSDTAEATISASLQSEREITKRLNAAGRGQETNRRTAESRLAKNQEKRRRKERGRARKANLSWIAEQAVLRNRQAKADGAEIVRQRTNQKRLAAAVSAGQIPVTRSPVGRLFANISAAADKTKANILAVGPAVKKSTVGVADNLAGGIAKAGTAAASFGQLLFTNPLAAFKQLFALGGRGFAGIIGGFTSVLGPVLGVTAAVLAAAAAFTYLLHRAGYLGPMVQNIRKWFTEVVGVLMKAFEGVRTAIELGDWGAALNIAWLGVKAAFIRGLRIVLESIPPLLAKIPQFVWNMTVALAETIYDIIAAIPKIIYQFFTTGIDLQQIMLDLLVGNTEGVLKRWDDSATKELDTAISNIQSKKDAKDAELAEESKKEIAADRAKKEADRAAQAYFEAQVKESEERMKRARLAEMGVDEAALSRLSAEAIHENNQAATERIKNLREEIGALQLGEAAFDQYKMTMDGVTANNRRAISALEAFKKALELDKSIRERIKGLNDEVRTMQIGKNAAELFDLAMQGATDSQLAAVRAAQNRNLFQETFRSLNESLMEIEFGANTAELMRLKQEGLTDAQLASVSAMQQLRDTMQESMQMAKDLNEQFKNPFAKAQEQYDKINRLQTQGLISAEVAAQAHAAEISKLYANAAKQVPTVGDDLRDGSAQLSFLSRAQQQFASIQAQRAGQRIAQQNQDRRKQALENAAANAISVGNQSLEDQQLELQRKQAGYLKTLADNAGKTVIFKM